MRRKKKEIYIVRSEKEQIGWRIWRALGRNNKRRRLNAFILLLTVMAFVTGIIFIVGKYQLVHILWGGK